MTKNDKVSGKSKAQLHKNHRSRHRNKLLALPLEAIVEHEFLEALLFSVVTQRNTNELAHELIDHFGSTKNVLLASSSELKRFKGLGEESIKQLKVIALTNKYIEVRAEASVVRYMRSPADSIEYFKEKLRGIKHEECHMLSLTKDLRLIEGVMVKRGGIDSLAIHPSEVVLAATKSDASNIIIAHNHPNGSLYPSENDLSFTEKLVVLLSHLNITLIEHYIITDDSHFALGCFSMDGKDIDFFNNIVKNNRHLLTPSYLNQMSAARRKFNSFLSNKDKSGN